MMATNQKRLYCPRPRPRLLPLPKIHVTIDGIDGWTTILDCNKVLRDVATATWLRPTTGHYFSRTHVLCASCFERLSGGFVIDYFEAKLSEPMRCGTRVTGDWRVDGGLVHPDYFPIESPRLFGLAVRGGEMKKHYDRMATERKAGE